MTHLIETRVLANNRNQGVGKKKGDPLWGRLSVLHVTSAALLRTYAYLAFSETHFMLTDLGRVRAEPTARFHTSWDRMPMERETLNSTV